jgi:hypothetical protein
VHLVGYFHSCIPMHGSMNVQLVAMLAVRPSVHAYRAADQVMNRCLKPHFSWLPCQSPPNTTPKQLQPVCTPTISSSHRLTVFTPFLSFHDYSSVLASNHGFPKSHTAHIIPICLISLKLLPFLPPFLGPNNAPSHLRLCVYNIYIYIYIYIIM